MDRYARKTALRGMALVLILLAAAALAMIYQAKNGAGADAASTAPGRESAVPQDIERLWTWTDAELSGGAPNASWHLRFDAAASVEDVERIALLLGIKALASDGTSTGPDEKDGLRGNLWQGGTVHGGGTLSLWAKRSGSESSDAALVIRYDHGAKASLHALLAQADAVLGAAADTGLEAKLTLKVHGYAIRGDSMSRLADLAGAESRDRYKDGGTVTQTYFTPLLKASVVLNNGKKGNLQLAAHNDTESGRIELTAGVPLITGDYSEAD